MMLPLLPNVHWQKPLTVFKLTGRLTFTRSGSQEMKSYKVLTAETSVPITKTAICGKLLGTKDLYRNVITDRHARLLEGWGMPQVSLLTDD